MNSAPAVSRPNDNSAGFVFDFLRALIDLFCRFVGDFFGGVRGLGRRLFYRLARTLRDILCSIFSILASLFHVLTSALSISPGCKCYSENKCDLKR